jgi:hypothetical protein
MSDFKVAWRRRVYKAQISSGSKVALLALAEYADWNTHSGAHPGMSRLVADTGLADKTVRRALAEGLALGSARASRCCRPGWCLTATAGAPPGRAHHRRWHVRHLLVPQLLHSADSALLPRGQRRRVPADDLDAGGSRQPGQRGAAAPARPEADRCRRHAASACAA